jgi:hypothetical protein
MWYVDENERKELLMEYIFSDPLTHDVQIKCRNWLR